MEAKRLESAVQSNCSQIDSLTVQHQKMMASLVALGIGIPQLDSSSDNINNVHKITTNKKNPNLQSTTKNEIKGWVVTGES